MAQGRCIDYDNMLIGNNILVVGAEVVAVDGILVIDNIQVRIPKLVIVAARVVAVDRLLAIIHNPYNDIFSITCWSGCCRRHVH